MSDDRWTVRNPGIRLLLVAPITLFILGRMAIREGWMPAPNIHVGFSMLLMVLVGYAALMLKMMLVQHYKHPFGEPD